MKYLESEIINSKLTFKTKKNPKLQKWNLGFYIEI